MTNAVNVEFIVDKLLSYLSEGSSDDHFRSDLVAQITQVGACLPPFIPPSLPNFLPSSLPSCGPDGLHECAGLFGGGMDGMDRGLPTLMRYITLLPSIFYHVSLNRFPYYSLLCFDVFSVRRDLPLPLHGMYVQ